jgi:RNA-directed DNA polymerase
LIDKLERLAGKSQEKFIALPGSGKIESKLTLLGTLRSVSIILEGWGNHYAFCNENNVLAQLDERVDEILREILGVYRSVRARCDRGLQRRLLGVPHLVSSFSKRTPQASSSSIIEKLLVA